MKKPGLLRAAIVALLPYLKRDPDKLAMWVERGSVRARQTAQGGFSWEYELTVVIEDYTKPPEALFFLVVDWLRTQQPDLLAVQSAGFPFEVDVIDEKTFDVKITLALREIVIAEKTADGWQLEVAGEQVPLFPDAEPLRAPDGPITSIWVRSNEGTFQVAPDA
ncbi:phage tail protein [Novosphingobium beihaiensis]|uniref:Phage tail protein n=1 Tax=Novosphingobium beihaiensis TaxID=2930389 RepID=A0ABT0BVR4_9SPHN|nr:phage tail protein [Novosphingobium beihaiensis]MCJ2189160.1 phage tail protein [Novosphingobium beihaiensis]